MLHQFKYKIIAFTILIASLNSSCKSGATHSQKETATILKADNYKHYVEYFNTMEDENLKFAIPNDSAWTWMKSNIPLFECPQQNFEEMYYYRWWTARKHIKKTPQGFAITEFLVDRSYADKYNMIACAVGHHINEFRWLHNPEYIEQDVHLWYRGDDGKPMKKLYKFSSWTADALYNRYLVNKDEKYLLDMYPDLVTDYAVWEKDRQRKDGLFWQHDVKDGMEESLSGGRKVQNARPTINSYMYGNAMALSKMAKMKGDTKQESYFIAKADKLQKLVETKL